MWGILFSSMRSRKAFSWLLQYSPYTENLSLCQTEKKKKTHNRDDRYYIFLPLVNNDTSSVLSTAMVALLFFKHMHSKNPKTED